MFNSCATILGGSQGKVNVPYGNPAPAKVYCNGVYQGTTPCSIKVPKGASKNGQTKIEISADGYKTATVFISRKVMVGYIVADVIITGAFGLIIDFAAGTIYKPYPKTINYNLEKQD